MRLGAALEQRSDADASDAGGGEYEPGGDSEGDSDDDEATLEEEEGLAAADAAGHQARCMCCLLTWCSSGVA